MSIFTAIRSTNLPDLNDLLKNIPILPQLENNTLHVAANHGDKDIVEALRETRSNVPTKKK